MAQSSKPARTSDGLPTVDWESLPERTMEYLVSKYGESQDTRVVGVFPSQSLHRVRDNIDAGDIIRFDGKRRVVEDATREWDQQNQQPAGFGMAGFRAYSDYKHESKECLSVSFDRTAVQAPFDESGLVEFLGENPDLYDIATNRLVIRFESDALYDKLLDILQEVAEFRDVGEFEQPFHAEMKSRPAGTKGLRRSIRQRHHENYFQNHESPASEDDDPPGMGWNLRTLDLVAIWSHRAWTNPGNVVAVKETGENVTMYGLEDQVFNQVSSDRPQYGAVNSKLVVNKWNTAFDTDAADVKQWNWDENGEWVLAGDSP